jgi:hypothetical protein
MRAESLVRPAAHHPKPLVIRGSLARTFGSLASFLALIFLLLGSYLLRDALAHPLRHSFLFPSQAQVPACEAGLHETVQARGIAEKYRSSSTCRWCSSCPAVM